MKKQLVASLAAAMVLGVAGTSFAAVNPFTDVPAKHWAYASVTKLAQAGIVDGYGDGTYLGDKMMSRYEMAQITAKAMAHSDKADAAQKAIIDQLSVEFASELEGLNVRVTKLEKNASSIKVTGEARLRFEDHDYAGNIDNTGTNLRTRVHLNGQINDQWGYYGRLQATNNMSGDVGTSTNTVTMDNAYVKGALAGTTATIGRFDYVINNGMMIDSTLNGVRFDFGNVLKTSVFYGKDNNNDNWGLAATNPARLEVAGVAFNYDTSKATNVNAGYYSYTNDDDASFFDTNEDSRKVWELGFKTKFAKNWALSGSYGSSDANIDDNAYFAQIMYKGADKAKVGSYGAWVNYRDLEANAAPRPTFNGKYANGSALNGGKGYEVGFNYTPMLNTVVRVLYTDVKASYTGAPTDKSKFIQAQAEFFF